MRQISISYKNDTFMNSFQLLQFSSATPVRFFRSKIISVQIKMLLKLRTVFCTEIKHHITSKIFSTRNDKGKENIRIVFPLDYFCVLLF